MLLGSIGALLSLVAAAVLILVYVFAIEGSTTRTTRH